MRDNSTDSYCVYKHIRTISRDEKDINPSPFWRFWMKNIQFKRDNFGFFLKFAKKIRSFFFPIMRNINIRQENPVDTVLMHV